MMGSSLRCFPLVTHQCMISGLVTLVLSTVFHCNRLVSCHFGLAFCEGQPVAKGRTDHLKLVVRYRLLHIHFDHGLVHHT